MILIFDCGSTKTKAALIRCVNSDPEIIELSKGVNALSMADGSLKNLIGECDTLVRDAEHINETYYYGAGCATGEACERVRKELSSLFRFSRIEVASDMLGAARAACGNSPGIVGILGTGSNSCLYDGKNIIDNVSPLGYILGDEGSGAVLGRQFLGRMLKGQFCDDVLKEFNEAYSLNIPDIITKIYRESRPNTFLASFAPFILQCCRHKDVNNFVIEEFRRYIRFNLLKYSGFRVTPVNFIGSVAMNFHKQLSEAMHAEGGIMGKIIQSPISALTAYHKSSHLNQC